jgi:hypothetical protein
VGASRGREHASDVVTLMNQKSKPSLRTQQKQAYLHRGSTPSDFPNQKRLCDVAFMIATLFI